MGGGSSGSMGDDSKSAQNTTTVVKPGVFPGYPGFKLTNPLYGACSIPYPENDTVLITGGNWDYPYYKVTAFNDKHGKRENFGYLNVPRRFHGCTSYITNKKRVRNIHLSYNLNLYSVLQVFLVTGGTSGGTNSLSTEIKDANAPLGEKWTLLKDGDLPLSESKYIYGLQGARLATLNNEVFSFGKI